MLSIWVCFCLAQESGRSCFELGFGGFDMADETPNNTMNLDLNLGPGSMSATDEDTINLDEWIRDPVERMREAVRRNNRQRWRWRPSENPMESESLLDLSHFLTSVTNQGGLHMGEGSVAGEGRAPEVQTEMIHVNKTIEVDDETLGIEDDGKGSNDDGSFYDCNICFELAKDPIITCCGHLYCWPCIYRWLHIHSDTNECPVCKGEVTTKNVTPVYGRGLNSQVPLEDLTLKIPPRPSAKRVESVQRNSFTNMEEMIRRLGSRFDLTQDFPAHLNVDTAVNLTERNPTFLLNRLMTTRAMRREQIQSPENVVDLTESRAASPDTLGHRGTQARLLRRSSTRRSPNTNNPFPSSMSTSERVIEAYMRSHPIVVRRPEQSSPVDDSDSFSSIAAVMHSGSQTMDTAVEIDSVVSLSTSSSRRRNDTSRASDVDSGDSRPPRRRRLN